MTSPGAPGLAGGHCVGNQNHHIRRQMITWTRWCPHFRHHRSPDGYLHPNSLMKSVIVGIHNSIQEGRQLEGQNLMNNEDWLLSAMRVLSLGVRLDSSVNGNSSPGGV